MHEWLGQEIGKLGFGMMRLPVGEDGRVDIAQVRQMADAFMAAGFTYFDTAYGYMDGRSEEVTREAVVERYPREAFALATKLPLWFVETAEDVPRLFDTQLERTAAGYFDFYLLHNLTDDRLAKMDEVDVWSFLRRKKEEGLVRHIGFSCHDDAEGLDKILTLHPELEFVQLQINYADWDDPKVQARLCYETARRHGKPVVIMEPVKGGALAAMGPEPRAVLEAARPDMSIAAWAMRFAASLEGVITVLSGMSTLDQMEDNIRSVAGRTPLTGGDRKAIATVQGMLAAVPTTPCTDCKYCIESGNCPQGIPIPAIIAEDNSRLIYARTDKRHYGFITKDEGKASDCIRCGACEARCPQHLPIMDLMAHCAATFEA